jgi:hydroxyacylglutathione hydrolase
MITDEGGGATEPMGVASGDFVFVGDLGRPDLLESAAGVEGAMREGARDLFRSVERFLELPDYLQVWPGHGAGSACGKALGAVPETTVGYERRFSPAVAAAKGGEEAFTRYVLDGQPEPPVYFGRVKFLNRDGPTLLRGLPRPREIDGPELAARSARESAVVVDTRRERSAFMADHLPGALFAPLDETFPTVTGCYVDPTASIILLVDEEDAEEAVRNLVRVGLDRVDAFARPSVLETWMTDGGRLESIPEIDVEALEGRRADPSSTVLDVRSAEEFREGHVPGALNIAHTRLTARLNELPRDRTLVVHCRTGSRSAVASALLAREGFRPVYVNGMFQDWLARFAADPKVATGT